MTDPNSNPAHVQPTGMLLIDKPLRRTSMDMCAHVRARLRRGGAPKRTRVGHGGTLDPLATGLLVILTGKGTKLTERIMVGEKDYVATVDLAHRSATDDAEGDREAIPIERVPERSDIEASLGAFRGTIMQTPPAYSAIKVDGKRAYALARSGEPPTLKARPVEVHAIAIEAYEFPELKLAITCGKGTYIRSLARDIGIALGTGGMLTALRRTRIGAFDVASAVTPDQLPAEMTVDDLLPIPASLSEPS